jgi:hypothetical protein
VLAGALVKPRQMTWYKAWREMLQGVLLEMSLVERRGGEAAGLVVGISSRSSSGSTMGIEYVVGLLRAVGLLGFSVGLGRRSWMGTCGAVCAVSCTVDGLASTLGGGEAGGLLGWRVGGGLLGWLASWRVGQFIGGLTSWRVGRVLGWLVRRSLVGRFGGGSRGLQLLATTVSSSSSSSERI